MNSKSHKERNPSVMICASYHQIQHRICKLWLFLTLKYVTIFSNFKTLTAQNWMFYKNWNFWCLHLLATWKVFFNWMCADLKCKGFENQLHSSHLHTFPPFFAQAAKTTAELFSLFFILSCCIMILSKQRRYNGL